MTNLILNIVIGVATFLATVIPAIILLVRAIKKKQAAATEAEKLAAEKELQEQKRIIIEETENLYKNVSPSLKTIGLPVDQLKKDSAMTKLRLYAMNKGLAFDDEYYSKEIDADIDHTKKVNYQTKTVAKL